MHDRRHFSISRIFQLSLPVLHSVVLQLLFPMHISIAGKPSCFLSAIRAVVRTKRVLENGTQMVDFHVTSVFYHDLVVQVMEPRDNG
jgi:hypothetical protein